MRFSRPTRLFTCLVLCMVALPVSATDDSCEAWSLLGYHIGMPKEEALAVHRADEMTPGRYRVCPGTCRFPGVKVPPPPHFVANLVVTEGVVEGLLAQLPANLNPDLDEVERDLYARLGEKRDLISSMPKELRLGAGEAYYWVNERCDTVISFDMVSCEGRSTEICRAMGAHAEATLMRFSLVVGRRGPSND